MAEKKLNLDDFKGFSKLDYQKRLSHLNQIGVLSTDQVQFLKNGGIQDISLGEAFIENTIGYFQLPLGLAVNFVVDQKKYVIPMAVEETSVVAAASKTARWVAENGKIETSVEGDTVVGQIHLGFVKDVEWIRQKINDCKARWMDLLNQDIGLGLYQRGGGVKDIQLRVIEGDKEKKTMGAGGELSLVVIHLLVNTCEAMGANVITQMGEFLRGPIEQEIGVSVKMAILSNYVESKITVAKITLPEVDPEIGQKIEFASYLAEQDSFRAATSNKGVLNGVDPVLIATGNDWRAVEAGMHSYACQTGRYKSLTRWRYQDGALIGELRAPIVVGTVGGVTKLHPTAQMCLNILNVNSSQELSRVIAAVGLVQNLGALKALTGEGLVSGHMKLHIKNLVLSVGALEEECLELESKLKKRLLNHKRITHREAKEELLKIREDRKSNLGGF